MPDDDKGEGRDAADELAEKAKAQTGATSGEPEPDEGEAEPDSV